MTRAVLLSGVDRDQAGGGYSVSKNRGSRKCRWTDSQV